MVPCYILLASLAIVFPGQCTGYQYDSQRKLRREVVTGHANVITSNENHADFNIPYDGTVKLGSESLYIYNYNISGGKIGPVRISVSSMNATPNYPVLFVIRQQRGVISWQVPLFLEDMFDYSTVNRTLCPTENYRSGRRSVDRKQLAYVDISTFSPNLTAFTLYAQQLENFEIGMYEERRLDVSPSEPIYYEFKFPDDPEVHSVTVKATSSDSLCMDLSIQSTNCPVFDLDRNVEFTGVYQTMTKQAAITVERARFKDKAFYVVFVVRATDYACTDIAIVEPAAIHGLGRLKTLSVIVEPSISYTKYMIAIGVTVGVFLFFYLVAAVVAFIHYLTQHRGEHEHLSGLDSTSNLENPIVNRTEGSSNYGTVVQQQGGEKQQQGGGAASSSPGYDSDSTIDEGEIDMLDDADTDKNIVRTKTFLYVADLARKDRRVLTKKYKLYHWHLITISIFYSLPVVQLVITYQEVLHVTGNEDICYYNFLCAHPLGVLSAFNNVFSNAGYVMLGLLFLGLIYRRFVSPAAHCSHRSCLRYCLPIVSLPASLADELPPHEPPTPSYKHAIASDELPGFADTSFMYIIAGLCMLKIYQSRHPDINANAYAAFAAFAVIIFLAVLGVVYSKVWFWALFFIVHVMAMLGLSTQIYYMGRWKLDTGIFQRVYLQLKNEMQTPSRPMYMDRMVLLIVGCLINLSLALYGVLTRPKDFDSYLLSIFIVNLLMYVLFYIIMKLRSGERILKLALFFICLATIVWGCALYFFLSKLSTWELTAAKSREGNRDCMILEFYDEHDVWHFLSATSMFFSFMILLTLDDDLLETPRDKIPVF
ncbi:PREDICTED: SID1 transmembrane family member 1-like [Priapulus caudatus]|uniref:SID1 transmembrane family member 1-like n=1 Tax=Priapulus caudatus TaxID=37621 RepID=A0ABM1EA68_PRICU|nr:PREDICTED: SID1 transmembrane family member 1-like [Priapulus caudatus]